MRYTIRYQAATYSGTRTVYAEDEEEAIEKVKRMIHKDMSLPMYYESYKVVSESEDDEDNYEN